MRHLLILLGLLLTTPLSGQEPANTWMETNSVRAFVKANGTLFQNGFQVPKTSANPTSKATVFRSVTPWIGGLDPGGNLGVSIGSLNAATSDFKAGIRGKPGYDRIWRVTKAQIVQHRADFADNGVIDNPIPAIMDWPGSLTFDEDGDGVEEIVSVAPTNVHNWDGTYNPEKGEHPAATRGGLIPGAGVPDEMIFFAFHDSTKHLYSKGDWLNIQVFCTLFAYNCPESEALNNTVFVHFKFWNRSAERLEPLFFGLCLDFDIGTPTDDYLGSGLYGNLFYAYNGDSFDENVFLQDPPVAAAMTIGTPLNNWGNATESTFIPIYNSPLGASFPQQFYEFYYYLMGRWRDDTPMTQGGSGYNPNSSAAPVFRAFPDAPGTPGGWSEPTAGTVPGSRMAVLSHEPITILPGGQNEMLTAFMWSRGVSPAPLSGYPSLESNAKWLQSNYKSFIDPNPPMPACLSYTVGAQEPLQGEVRILPNPAGQVVSVTWPDHSGGTVRVFDLLGRPVFSAPFGTANASLEIPVAEWTEGLYLFQVSDERGGQQVIKVCIEH